MRCLCQTVLVATVKPPEVHGSDRRVAESSWWPPRGHRKFMETTMGPKFVVAARDIHGGYHRGAASENLFGEPIFEKSFKRLRSEKQFLKSFSNRPTYMFGYTHFWVVVKLCLCIHISWLYSVLVLSTER